MTSNYKLSTNAYNNYSNSRITENFDLTHDQVHTLKSAIDKNYEQGGGFGYICLPAPKPAGETTSNFDDPGNVECRAAFIPPNLVKREGGDPANQSLNARTFQGEEYYIFPKNTTDLTKTSSAWVPADATAAVPAQNWKAFSGL